MNCPKCNRPDVEVLAVEVDIGVGVQTHVQGWDCPTCGQLAAQSCCGAVFPEHQGWCRVGHGLTES